MSCTNLTKEDKEYLIDLLSSYKVIKPTAQDERNAKNIVKKLRKDLEE